MRRALALGLLLACLVVGAALVVLRRGPRPPRLEGRRLLVVLFEGYQPKEFGPVREVLVEAGAVVDVLAVNRTVDVPYRYYIMDVRGRLAELAREYDALVIIGGPGVYARVVGMVREPGLPYVEELCRLFRAEGKVVAAICAAPAILARAGVLRGLKASCYPAEPLVRILEEGGAAYVPKAVVVDDGVLTAWGPPAAREFALRLCELLAGSR